MRKIIFTIVLLFVALNTYAAISQSGITNLKQLDKNGIIDLVNGNQLIGFISDGPFEGPITQTYFKDGTYETVYENNTYKGKWRAEGESYSSVDDKKMCTKNNNASQWSCFHWYTGIKDGGTFAYVVAQGKIFHQYHEVISIDQANQKKKNVKKEVKDKLISETKDKEKLEKKDTPINKDSAYVKQLKETVDYLIKSISDRLAKHSKYFEDKDSNKYKVEFDELFSTIKNNTDPSSLALNKYKESLVNLNRLTKVEVVAEEKRIAKEKKAEEKRIEDVKKEERSIENYTKNLKRLSKKLQDLEFDSEKVKVDELISEVEANTSSDLIVLKGLTKNLREMNSSVDLKIKTEESKQRILSLKDYPGFRDLKPGLNYEDLTQFCPLRKNAWVNCYGIDNIKFKGKYQSNVLKQLTIDMGPIVNTSGFLSVFGENDSNIFIKMQDTFDKKYTFDYGYSERDRQLFNESEKSHLYRVYSKGQVALEIGRKEKDWSSDLWLYIHYFESSKAERFLKENRPVRASDDDF